MYQHIALLKQYNVSKNAHEKLAIRGKIKQLREKRQQFLETINRG